MFSSPVTETLMPLAIRWILAQNSAILCSALPWLSKRDTKRAMVERTIVTIAYSNKIKTFLILSDCEGHQ